MIYTCIQTGNDDIEVNECLCIEELIHYAHSCSMIYLSDIITNRALPRITNSLNNYLWCLSQSRDPFGQQLIEM